MKDRIVLLTKDALCKSYLPIYGNNRCVMPNLSELAGKGTIFNRFYTAAPSTAMSFISMFLGKNPYETGHKKYVAVTDLEKNTVFDKLHDMGYDCQIIWDEKWISMAKKYSQCYGEHTVFNLINVNQTVGAHNTYLGEIKNNDELAEKTLDVIEESIAKVVEKSKDKLFLWIHLPHVLQGRNCYGSDMDMFDRVIGAVRNYFSDDCVYISADHGNMNGVKNKICYGFDVYESAINIPLITPKINGLEVCNTPISNTRIMDVIGGKIPKDEFVYSDCAYYAQPHRRLAIVRGNYKYIYNKRTKNEELYDLEYDPNENCNIASKKVFDIDRKILTPLNQVYYYPRWETAFEELEKLRKEKERIWRDENIFQHIKGVLREKAIVVYERILQRSAK